MMYFISACARVKCIVFNMYCTSILAEAWYMQRDPKKKITTPKRPNIEKKTTEVT